MKVVSKYRAHDICIFLRPYLYLLETVQFSLNKYYCLSKEGHMINLKEITSIQKYLKRNALYNIKNYQYFKKKENMVINHYQYLHITTGQVKKEKGVRWRS